MRADKRNKLVAKNTMFLYVRMVLLIGVNLYTSRVLLKAMGVEDFGIYNVVGGIVFMFSFLNTAMAVGSQRYLSYEIGKKTDRVNEVFNTSVNVHFFISLCVLLLAETFGLWFLNTHMNIPHERIDAANVVFHASVLSFALMINSVPYTAFIMSKEDMNVYAGISSLDILLRLCAAIIIGTVSYDALKLYPILLVVISILVLMVYMFYCRTHYKESRYKLSFNRSLFVELLTYSNWNMFGGVASVCNNYGVNILLNIVFNGTVINAARAIAYQVNTAVTQFTVNFQSALNPPIVKAYANGDHEYMRKLIYRGARYSYLLLFFIVLPLFIQTPYILDLWLPIIPEHAITFVRWILAASLVDSFSGTLLTSSLASGRIKKYQLVVGIWLLFNLPVSYVLLLLVPQPEVVFVVNFVFVFIALFLRLYMVSHLVNITIKDFLKETIVRMLPITILCPILPICCSMYMQEGLMEFVLTIITSVISCMLFYWIIGLRTDERKFVADYISNKINRLRNK